MSSKCKICLPGGRRCPAADCYNHVKQGHILCRECWRFVPNGVRSRIFATYRRHETELFNDACAAAILSVPPMEN